MHKHKQAIMRMLAIVGVLTGLSGMLVAAAGAVPGNPAGQDARSLAAITGFTVTTDQDELPAGGTANVFVTANGTRDAGETTTVVVTAEGTGLTVETRSCAQCVTDDPPTYQFEPGSGVFAGIYTVAPSFTVTVPATALAGDTYTLRVTAVESPSDDVEFDDLVFTIQGQSIDQTPTATSVPATATTVPATATSVPATATATATQGVDMPTATATPGTPPATATATPVAGDANVSVNITSGDPGEANVLPAGSVLEVSQGETTVYDITLQGPGGAPITLPLGPVSLNSEGEPFDFPYGDYTITVDAGDDFEVYTAQVTFDQPQETVNIVLEVDDGTSELVEALIAKLKEILRDVLDQ